MTDTQDTMTVWDLLEQPNRFAPETQALYSWGLNCDYKNNPFWHFLDMIGYTDEHGLGNMSSTLRLGYMEAGYLADALTEWADNPYGVEAWLDKLMACHD